MAGTTLRPSFNYEHQTQKDCGRGDTHKSELPETAYKEEYRSRSREAHRCNDEYARDYDAERHLPLSRAGLVIAFFGGVFLHLEKRPKEWVADLRPPYGSAGRGGR